MPPARGADGRFISVRIGLDASAYERGARRAAEATNKIAGGAKGALRHILGLGAAFGGFAILKSIAAEGNAFTNAINTMGAVSHASAAQMTQVAAAARALGRDSTIAGASSVDAAQAMTELAKAGFTVQQSLTAAKGTLQLAAAAQVEAAQAAEIEANALNAFGLSADKASYVADLLANAANASSAEITDMAWALKSVGAVANQFKISLGDTTTALGLFANAGIKGSDAGTMLKSGLLAMANPSGPAAKAMHKLGLEAYDAQGKFVGLKSVFGQLQAASKRMTDQQYQQATAALFGSDAARMAGLAANISAAQWDKMAASLAHTGGASELAAAKMKGLPGQVEAFKNVLSDVKLSLYNAFGPLAAKFVGLFTEGLTAAGPGLEKFANWAAKSLPHAFDVARASVVNFFKGFAGGDTVGLEGIQAKVAKFGETARKVFDGIKPIFGNIVAAVKTIAPAFVDLMKAAGPLAASLGTSLIGGFRTMGTVLQASAPFIAGALRLLADTLSALTPVLKVVGPAVAAVFLAFRGWQSVTSATQAFMNFSQSLGRTFSTAVMGAGGALSGLMARMGASRGVISGWGRGVQVAANVASRVGQALPIIGIGFSLIGSAIEKSDEEVKQATDSYAAMEEKLGLGGAAAGQAAAQFAGMTAKIAAYRKEGGMQVEIADKMQAAMDAGHEQYVRQQADMTMTQLAQQQVTKAENDYQSALLAGEGNSAAVLAAHNALIAAKGALKLAEDAVASAGKTVTEMLQEQTNAILANINADIANSQATLAAKQATDSYIAAMKDSNITEAERVAAANNTVTAYSSKVAALMAAAHTEAETQTAVSKSIEFLLAQKTAIESSGAAFPPAAQEMLTSMMLTRAGVSDTSGAFEALKGHVLDVPDSKTIKTDALTQETIDKLEAVGLSVTENAQDHTFTVTANYVEVHTRIDNARSEGSWRAEGGWVSGAGGPKDDKVTLHASPGEFVVNAAAAKRNAGLLEALNGGRDIMSETVGKLGVPRFASAPTAPRLSPAAGRPVVINVHAITTLDGKVVARSVNRVNADLERRR